MRKLSLVIIMAVTIMSCSAQNKKSNNLKKTSRNGKNTIRKKQRNCFEFI